MKKASSKYKLAMNDKLRRCSHIRVSIGIINHDAQRDGKITGEESFLNKMHTSVFEINEPLFEYATYEENVFRVDGSMYFPPESEDAQTLQGTGFLSKDLLQSAKIYTSEPFDFKGMTINFGENYPTEFTITDQDGKVTTYQNDVPEFVTEDVFTNIQELTITPVHFVNGDNKRLRIFYFLFGVGLYFNNENIKTSAYNDENSYICENLPNVSFSYTFFDKNRKFLVDDKNSFINYLETEQEIEVAYGIEIDDEGTVEYIDMPTVYLDSWSRDALTVTINASDRTAFLDGTYKPNNSVHERTLYDDAMDIVTQAGLEPDMYEIDEYLKDVTVVNPLPEESFANCLQLVANAGRCILSIGRTGEVVIKANFANVLDPMTYEPSSNTQADWSKVDNVLKGTEYLYVDMTKDFTSVNNTMYFLPENDEDYLETSFVSREIADENGDFTEIPSLELQLPAAFTYYSFKVLFSGNPPKKMRLQTYKYGKLVDDCLYADLKIENEIDYAFDRFDKIVISFPQGSPQDRVLLNKFTFGDLSGYTLRLDDTTKCIGTVESRVKNLSVRIFTFENNEEGVASQVDDSVWFHKRLANSGENAFWENQLISTEEHAKQIAQWVGNYYSNNITYQVDFRGEPRLDSTDIIHMESEILNNLQVEIDSTRLTFDGAFKGVLNLRRATNMLLSLEDGDIENETDNK